MNGGLRTVSVADELTITPAALLATTEYDPASVELTLLIVKVLELAPIMFTPFFIHW